MIRINNAYFYELGSRIHPLVSVEPTGDKDSIWIDLILAQSSLRGALMSEVIPLRTCVQAGWNLDSQITKLAQKLREPEEIEPFAFQEMKRAAREFETVLNAELQVMDSYFVTQKALYSTRDLIDRAEITFPKTILPHVPKDTIDEIQQAGKCLAFEVATAAGFHILRATEAVIREYYSLLVGNLTKKKARNWGVYITALKKKGADAKIVLALEQVKDMYRNPIIHPEDTLTTDEATSLFGIAQGVIIAMIADMEKRRAAATAAAAALLPPTTVLLPPAAP